MNQLLHNPVYYALISGGRHLSFGEGSVKYFDEKVSPSLLMQRKNTRLRHCHLDEEADDYRAYIWV